MEQKNTEKAIIGELQKCRGLLTVFRDRLISDQQKEVVTNLIGRLEIIQRAFKGAFL